MVRRDPDVGRQRGVQGLTALRRLTGGVRWTRQQEPSLDLAAERGGVGSERRTSISAALLRPPAAQADASPAPAVLPPPDGSRAGRALKPPVPRSTQTPRLPRHPLFRHFPAPSCPSVIEKPFDTGEER